MSYDIISHIGIEKEDWDRGLIEIRRRAREIADKIDNTMNSVLRIGKQNFGEAGIASKEGNYFGNIPQFAEGGFWLYCIRQK